VQFATVNFHGDQLLGVRNDNGAVVIPIKPICDALGLLWPGQFKRLRRDEFLAEAISMMEIPFGRQRQEMVCLTLNRINFWLATVDTGRIADPAVRTRIKLYKAECADVLAAHFRGAGLDEYSVDLADRQVLNATPNVPVILQAIGLACRVWGEFEAQRLWLQHPEMPLTPRMRQVRARVIDVTSDQADFDPLWSKPADC
jgi:hypothetical protein